MGQLNPDCLLTSYSGAAAFGRSQLAGEVSSRTSSLLRCVGTCFGGVELRGQAGVAKKLILFILATFSVLPVLGANVVYADNDFFVYSPHVVQGQREVEIRGFGYQDGRSDLNGAGGYNISLAHAVTDWWKPEVYVGEFNRTPGGSVFSSGYEFENTMQLSAPGECWADFGLLASYVDSTQPGISSIAEFGPLLEKMSGHIDQRLNLIFTKQIGGGASSAIVFRSAYSINYNFHADMATYSPGLEAYYRPADNAYQIGPIFSGELRTDGGNELEYSIGEVFGINSGAPSRTLLARLGYDFF